MYISLNKISDVKEFVSISLNLCGDITLSSKKHCVDGKSILGIFSLDLSNPVELKCQNEADYAAFEQFGI